MSVCKSLRGYCLRHEWAACAFSISGIAILAGGLWAVLAFRVEILNWVNANLLLNGLAAAGSTALTVMVAAGCLCLGFSECSSAERNCLAVKGQRMFDGGLKFIDSLGSNPRRASKR